MKLFRTPESEALEADRKRTDAREAMERITNRLAELALYQQMDEIIGDEWQTADDAEIKKPYDYALECPDNYDDGAQASQSNVIPFRRRA